MRDAADARTALRDAGDGWDGQDVEAGELDDEPDVRDGEAPFDDSEVAGNNSTEDGGAGETRTDVDASPTVEAGADSDDARVSEDGGGDASQPTCDPTNAPDIGRPKLETVISGLSRLVYAAQPPGSSDWYLVQQAGKILILPGATVLPATAASTAQLVDVSADVAMVLYGSEDERGLLGLAFAPDFASSGLFYVAATSAPDNVDYVLQYQKSGATATLKARILTFPASYGNHNGGTLVFGPDGMLYVSTGDGGSSCNVGPTMNSPQLVSADPLAWFGKILRLDPNNAAGGYAAPGSPFSEGPLVWHYGLRNPFRFSFDRRTGDLYIGDVGQDAYEEVNYAKQGERGLNYGWATSEANQMTCANRPLRAGSVETKAIFVADRRAAGCMGPFCDWRSVIGGVVYRGSALPRLYGAYLFGDYVGARMAALRQCASGTSPVTPIRKHCAPVDPSEACFNGTDFSELIAIVEDNSAELYFVADRNSLLKLVAGP